VDPMTGIEPAYSAWEVDSLRLRPERVFEKGLVGAVMAKRK
jgi:hypothetical protein